MYKSPGAMEMALKARARGVAKPQNISTEDLLRRFHFQRLLARVFTQEGWLLKGGQALLVRYGAQARYSRDIDLFRPGVEELTEAIEALRHAASLDLDDFFTFTEAGPVNHADETGGAKLKFTVLIGIRKVGTINVDIVVRRKPTSEPTITRLAPAVPVDWPTDCRWCISIRWRTTSRTRSAPCTNGMPTALQRLHDAVTLPTFSLSPSRKPSSATPSKPHSAANGLAE